MRRLRISPLAMLGLLLLTALNGSCLWWISRTLGDDGSIWLSAVAWAPDAAISPIDPVRTQTPPNAYPESLARPIFFRDRRPFVAPPPSPPPAPPPIQVQPAPVVLPPPPVTKPDLVVSGIALIGNAKQAYLESGSKQNGVWVKQGDDVTGWRVSAITSAGVTISKTGQSFDLLLYPPTGPE